MHLKINSLILYVRNMNPVAIEDQLATTLSSVIIVHSDELLIWDYYEIISVLQPGIAWMQISYESGFGMEAEQQSRDWYWSRTAVIQELVWTQQQGTLI